MTPKEKAKELFDKFYYLFPEKHRIEFGYQESISCALITVDEMMQEVMRIADEEIITSRIIYWRMIKQEIEKL